MKLQHSDGFDPSRFKDLPTLSFSEAAWFAGITLEAFERVMTEGNHDDLRNIPLPDLVRTGYTLLAQKESQLTLFRMQLAAALKREQELAELLHTKLAFSFQETSNPPGADDASLPETSAAPIKPDKGKKKKKRK